MGPLGAEILLVEDDQNDIELVLTVLSSTPISNRIAVAHDGEEALDYLHRRGKFASRTGVNPLVVFLDLKMPKVSGVEVLRAIKSDPVLQTIPGVMLTSSRVGGDLEQCYRLGANAYVVKPVDFLQYREALRATGIFWSKVNEPPPAE